MLNREVCEVVEERGELNIAEIGIFLFDNQFSQIRNQSPILPFGELKGHDSKESKNVRPCEKVRYYVSVHVSNQ